MTGPTRTGGLPNDIRTTPAVYAADEARELKQQYFSGNTTPNCPRCGSAMEVETGWKARFLLTELSCTACRRCIMFRPDRDTTS